MSLSWLADCRTKGEFRRGQGPRRGAQPYGVLKQALKGLDLVDLDARRSSLERVQRIKEAAGEGLQALGTVRCPSRKSEGWRRFRGFTCEWLDRRRWSFAHRGACCPVNR